jgi:hypothetical protein
MTVFHRLDRCTLASTGWPTANDLPKSLRTVQGLAAFCRPRGRFQTGLGLSRRHCWNTAVFISFGQPHHATAVWLLGVLLGIQLICEGVALSSLAWQVRSERVSCALLSIRSFQRRSEPDGRSRISGGIDTAVGTRWLQHRLPPLRTASRGPTVNTLQILI